MQFRRPKLLSGKSKNPAQKTKKSITPKNVPSGCSHFYGYLAKRPKNTPIPQECLFCLKVTSCMSGELKT